MMGKIKYIHRNGFLFITGDNDTEYFAHSTSFKQVFGFSDSKVNDRVSFSTRKVEGKKNIEAYDIEKI